VSGIELVAGVITAFFAFGIVAGVLAVIALSALRRHRQADDGHPPPPPPPPRWPGDHLG
jgi:hypothetical protein